MILVTNVNQWNIQLPFFERKKNRTAKHMYYTIWWTNDFFSFANWYYVYV